MCSLGLGLTPPPGPAPQGQWMVDDLVRLGCALDIAYGVIGDAITAGLVEVVGRASGARGGVIHQLTPAGEHAARQTLEGSTPPEAIGGDWRRHVWQACRMAKRFVIPDLMATLGGGASYDKVYRYVKRLERAGALAKLPRTGTHQPWRLALDEGPTPPCN